MDIIDRALGALEWNVSEHRGVLEGRRAPSMATGALPGTGPVLFGHHLDGGRANRLMAVLHGRRRRHEVPLHGRLAAVRQPQRLPW